MLSPEVGIMMRELAIIMAFGLLAIAPTTGRADEPPPDPLELLKGVEQDRLAIESGRVELEFRSSRPGKPGDWPFRASLVGEFDGAKLRFEDRRVAFNIDQAYEGAFDAKMKRLDELGGDRDEFVRQKLGRWSNSLVRTILDGDQILQYADHGESDYGGSATLRARDDPSGDFCFDPRVLGLTSSPSPGWTVGSCLQPRAGEAVKLIGREDVLGHPAWHLRIEAAPGPERHIWIESSPSRRVLKVEERGQVVRHEIISQYGPPDEGPSSSLPMVVTTLEYRRPDAVESIQVVTRGSTRIGEPFDPGAFTLGGLDMPIGTVVTDLRIHRRVGYWDGKKLSEAFVPLAPRHRDLAPRRDLGEQMAMARRDPDGPIGLDSLAYVVIYRPGAVEVDEAVAMIADHHARSRHVGSIALQIDRPGRDGERLFRAILGANPHPQDLTFARFGLGKLLKKRFQQSGQDDGEDRREAMRLLEAVIAEPGGLTNPAGGRALAEDARAELEELRPPGVARPAP